MKIVKELIKELSDFNTDAEITFVSDLETPKYTDSYGIIFTPKDHDDTIKKMKQNCKKVTICIGSDWQDYTERKLKK